MLGKGHGGLYKAPAKVKKEEWERLTTCIHTNIHTLFDNTGQ